MAGRSATGFSQRLRLSSLWALHLVRACRLLRTRNRRSGIARPTLSYGSIDQARSITLRATLGMVERVLPHRGMRLPIQIAALHRVERGLIVRINRVHDGYSSDVWVPTTPSLRPTLEAIEQLGCKLGS